MIPLPTDNDIPLYRKRAKHTAPKKHHHKHDFRPCVYTHFSTRFSQEHGVTHDEPHTDIGTYCPICGKVGNVIARSPEWVERRGVYPIPYTSKALRELDPNTRTLPTFHLAEGWLQKYISLE